MAYRIVVKGVQEGQAQEQVVSRLAKLFRSSEEQTEKILAGGSTTVKKGVDAQTAAKYVAAIEACGALVVMEPEAAGPEFSASLATPEEVTSAPAMPVLPIAPVKPAEPAMPAVSEPLNPDTAVSPGRLRALGGKLRPLLGTLGNRRILAGVGVLLAVFGTAVLVRPLALSYWQQYQRERVIDNLSNVRPSTFGAVQVTATAPVGNVSPIDWTHVKPQSDVMKKAMAALQVKNDLVLKEPEYAFLYPFNYFRGAAEEPEKAESDLREELDSLVQTSPEITVAIGEWFERIDEPEEALTWYSKGMARKVAGASGKFLSMLEKSGDHLRLARFFAGLEPSPMGEKLEDPRRAALHFGEAASQNPQVFNDRKLRGPVLLNGPEIAAIAWKALLPAAGLAKKVSEPITACDEKGADIADPANRGKGFAPNAAGGLEECMAATVAAPDNARIWYQFGYALQRNNEWNKAKIAYARAAQLGSAMGIARFWWIELYSDEKRGFTMLEAEAAAGNIWGEYFRGLALYAGVDSGRDYGKAEVALLKADSAGIRYAEVILGEMFRDKGDAQASLAWYTRAADVFPHMREFVAQLNKASEAPAKGERGTSQPRGPYVRAGAVACQRTISFVKVAAIERTNNPYVSLPQDCETVPFDLPTTFTKYVPTPTGSDLINVGTPAGSFYVRNYDVAY